MDIDRHIAAIALGMVLACGLASASTAGAATVPATYTSGAGCQVFSQNTTEATNPNIPQGLLGLTADTPKDTFATVDVHRPVSVANYTGTTWLYWDTHVYELNSAHQWASLGTIAGAYASVFFHSGNQLTSIYWANAAPPASDNTGFDINNPEGHRFAFVGETYWWNGVSWFYSNGTSLGECQF